MEAFENIISDIGQKKEGDDWQVFSDDILDKHLD